MLDGGQAHSYLGAAFGGVDQGQFAAVAGDDGLHDGQSEPGAAFLGREKGSRYVAMSSPGKPGPES